MRIFFLLITAFSGLTGHSQMFQKVRQQPLPGYYWDLNGNKQEGKVQVYCTTNIGVGTFIRISQNGNKRTKITQDQMKSFVIGVDSFTLISNFNPSNLAYYKLDFANVVATGSIDLYRHYRRKRQTSSVYMGSGMGTTTTNILIERYVISQDGTKTFHGIYNKSTFERYFLPMIKDYPELHARVLAMKPRHWVGSIGTLLAEYNKFKKENP